MNRTMTIQADIEKRLFNVFGDEDLTADYLKSRYDQIDHRGQMFLVGVIADMAMKTKRVSGPFYGDKATLVDLLNVIGGDFDPMTLREVARLHMLTDMKQKNRDRLMATEAASLKILQDLRSIAKCEGDLGAVIAAKEKFSGAYLKRHRGLLDEYLQRAIDDEIMERLFTDQDEIVRVGERREPWR